MPPRSNFECSKCGKIEDLPIDVQACPYCRRRRGFVRLFDAVNVMSGKSRKLSKVLDKQLAPMYEKHADTKASAAAFDKLSSQAMEQAYEKATPAERAKMQPMTGHVLPAASVLGGMPPAARQDSREVLMPAVTNRKVKPQWHS